MPEPVKTTKQEDPRYEQVWSIQEAINKAVAEKRVVRFISPWSNKELKAGIVDKKGA